MKNEMKSGASSTKLEYDLAENQVLSLRDLEAGRVLYCLAGMMWVTQEGDRRDRVLGPGGAYAIERAGRVVIAALRRTHLIVASREQIDTLETLKASLINREEVA